MCLCLFGSYTHICVCSYNMVNSRLSKPKLLKMCFIFARWPNYTTDHRKSDFFIVWPILNVLLLETSMIPLLNWKEISCGGCQTKRSSFSCIFSLVPVRYHPGLQLPPSPLLPPPEPAGGRLVLNLACSEAAVTQPTGLHPVLSTLSLSVWRLPTLWTPQWSELSDTTHLTYLRPVI